MGRPKPSCCACCRRRVSPRERRADYPRRRARDFGGQPRYGGDGVAGQVPRGFVLPVELGTDPRTGRSASARTISSCWWSIFPKTSARAIISSPRSWTRRYFRCSEARCHSGGDPGVARNGTEIDHSGSARIGRARAYPEGAGGIELECVGRGKGLGMERTNLHQRSRALGLNRGSREGSALRLGRLMDRLVV
jgi:hypothetical protein